MSKGRLEAFSDGVMAIIITIMVLELRAPASADVAALVPLVPIFLSYVLSFVYLGIYWNNHHHLLQAVDHVQGGVLWANLHLLFWLSLIPFTTAWMGHHRFAPWPVVAYGLVLLCCAVAYFILTRVLVSAHHTNARLAAALGNDVKGKVSIVLYVAGLAAALVAPRLACALFAVVAIVWLVPDRRIERTFAS